MINDEKEFGITVHYVDNGIDTGDIILRKCYEITDSDDYSTLLEWAYIGYAEVLYGAIKLIQSENVNRINQNSIDPVGLYCGMRTIGDELLDWRLSSRDIFNFVRAICKPGPQALTFLDNKPVHINRVRLVEGAHRYKGTVGQIIGKTDKGWYVKTLDTMIRKCKMKNIAIIPARSGTKDLKDKNIKILNGKLLLWYIIQAAINSGCFDEVMVSTDSEKYANIAKEFGASVPFLRSKETSGDKASSWDTVVEVLKKYKDLGKVFDYGMLLQPTSPLRISDDIKKAFELLTINDADGVVSVCEMEHSPLWSNTLPENKNLVGVIRPEVEKSAGRQDLPTYYRINGAIYLAKINYEKLNFDLFTENSFALIIPRGRAIDIDSEFEFIMAEQLIKNFKMED